MIQILEFRPSSRRPAIRSYPMTVGTLVVLAENVHALTLTMSRAEQADTIPIDKGERFDATMERLWAALLSTAPTPPLSDEGLVG
jgi:hypothetical protein